MEFPLLAVRRVPRYLPALILSMLIWASMSGCGGVKQTIKVAPQQSPLLAKKASFDDLMKIIRSYDKVEELSSNNLDFTITLTKNRHNGILEKYRTLRGYVLLKRPESLRLVLQLPIVKSRFLDIVSVGDDLSVDYPRENKFFKGKNSAKELVAADPDQSSEFTIPIRGPHIFEAIFPQSVSLDAPGTWISMEEQQYDGTFCYVLSIGREGTAPRMHTVRKIWIERTGLTIARQQVFSDEGEIVSDIRYSRQTLVDEVSLPLQITVERPADGYILDLQFENWKVNDVPEDAFVLTPASQARVIYLKDKSTSDFYK